MPCAEAEMDARKELHRALSNLQVEHLRRLLRDSSRLVVNHRDPSCGLQTLLMRLCHVHLNPEERSDLFTLLIERGADVNQQDSSGRTALAHSCIAEKMDLMELLASVPECDVNIVDNDGNSPLMYAVKSRQVQVVKKLLEEFKDRGIDVHLQNTKGLCVLTEAESRFDGDICRVLIKEGGADPARLDMVQYGRTGPRSPRLATSPEMLPTSPRLVPRSRIHRQRSDPLCPLIVHGRIPLAERSHSADAVPTSLSESFSAFRQRSFDSCSTTSVTESELDLPEVQEEDENEDIDGDAVLQSYGSLLRRRRNSKSLPDLRDIPCKSSGSSPSLSPRSIDESYPHSRGQYTRSHTLDDSPSLARVYEEEESEDEESLPSPTFHHSRRRDSLSLPDLRTGALCLIARTLGTHNHAPPEETNAYSSKKSKKSKHKDRRLLQSREKDSKLSTLPDLPSVPRLQRTDFCPGFSFPPPGEKKSLLTTTSSRPSQH